MAIWTEIILTLLGSLTTVNGVRGPEYEDPGKGQDIIYSYMGYAGIADYLNAIAAAGYPYIDRASTQLPRRMAQKMMFESTYDAYSINGDLADDDSLDYNVEDEFNAAIALTNRGSTYSGEEPSTNTSEYINYTASPPVEISTETVTVTSISTFTQSCTYAPSTTVTLTVSNTCPASSFVPTPVYDKPNTSTAPVTSSAGLNGAVVNSNEYAVGPSGSGYIGVNQNGNWYIGVGPDGKGYIGYIHSNTTPTASRSMSRSLPLTLTTTIQKTVQPKMTNSTPIPSRRNKPASHYPAIPPPPEAIAAADIAAVANNAVLNNPSIYPVPYNLPGGINANIQALPNIQNIPVDRIQRRESKSAQQIKQSNSNSPPQIDVQKDSGFFKSLPSWRSWADYYNENLGVRLTIPRPPRGLNN